MKISEIKELIKLLNETEISEFEFENESGRLILRKERTYVQAPILEKPQLRSIERIETEVTTKIPDLEVNPTNHKIKPVKSPMVGTFYSSPRPDSDPFVKVGDRVNQGQVLCIIEAMKLMNEIEGEFTGKVLDILVEDGQAVEYGQNLFLIEID